MKKTKQIHIPRDKSPIFIAGVYIIISILWIIYSDKAVEIIAGTSSTTLSLLQTIKGGFFVISTGLLLYFLISSRVKKLRISETRFKTLAENTPDAIVCLDLKGGYIFGNSEFEKQSEISDKELYGKKITDFKFNDDIIELWENSFQQVLDSKRPVRIEFQTKENRWLDLIMAPQFSENNAIVSIVSSSRDITEKKIMQEQLQQSQKMQAIGQLAGGIAHDFNNILSVIIGYSDMALNRSGVDEIHKDFLENIQKAGLRAKVLVRQILTFSRKKTEVPKPIYLKPIIEEVVGLLKETLPSTIDFIFQVENDSAPVLADSAQVHEILMNLATNAIHAMDEKGRLDIRLYEKVVKEDFYGISGMMKSGIYSVIEVQDNGHGIKQEIIKRIFEPFFTTKEVGKGTGLGLSVVFGLIQSWKGDIQVLSNIGEGSTFSIYLPKTEIDNGINYSESEDKNLKRGNEKIIFVDDEVSIAKMGEQMLSFLGYNVVSICDSTEALRLIKENIHNFDLLISDQTMPHMTGIELVKEIHKDYPDFPVLLTTGYSTKLDENKALKLGCNGFVHKPLTLLELSENVRKVLG